MSPILAFWDGCWKQFSELQQLLLPTASRLHGGILISPFLVDGCQERGFKVAKRHNLLLQSTVQNLLAFKKFWLCFGYMCSIQARCKELHKELKKILERKGQRKDSKLYCLQCEVREMCCLTGMTPIRNGWKNAFGTLVDRGMTSGDDTRFQLWDRLMHKADSKHEGPLESTWIKSQE